MNDEGNGGKTRSSTRSEKNPSAVPPKKPAQPAILTAPTVARAELNAFLRLKHGDPHAILGAHHFNGGVVIRAFRPDAEKIEVLSGRKQPLPMTMTHPAGLFEILLPDLAEIPTYRFRVYYAKDRVFTLRDPYSYLPTLGDLDLHLFAEGKHESIYEKLGAHVLKLGSIRGVSFAVWAPTAEGVSVVGDFNGWDGRLHQMRRIGVSGVWELFVPDLGPGALYKFEIRTRRRQPFLKADPYANYTEIPPLTSSIVFQSKYKFRDREWLGRRVNREHFRQPLSIYEVHFGSWRRRVEEDNRPFSYREMAGALSDYVQEPGSSGLV